jgi:hypothetical protein
LGDRAGEIRGEIRTISGFPTKKAAEAAMQLELHQRRSGAYIEKSPETVGELLARWLDTVARHKVSASTTVQLCHLRLSQALALAEREGIVPRDASGGDHPGYQLTLWPSF